MKKKYQAPQMEVFELDLQSELLAMSPGLDGVVGDGETGEGEGPDPNANRHRGEWGNLWAED